MSNFKPKKLAMAVALGTMVATVIPGCVTVKNYKQEFLGMDKSSRESTGYYDYKEAKLKRNTIVVPDNLDNPGENTDLQIKFRNLDSINGKLGEEVDVRPPTAPYRSDLGLHSQWASGEAIVWFEVNGPHGIHTEDDAWMLLDKVLRSMRVGVGKVGNGEYILTTLPRDYDEYGKTYSESDEDEGLLRYTQVYQIRVGRNHAGEIGIATKVISSSTSLSNNHSMDDLLSLVEQERFSMGFSNNIVHEISLKNEVAQYDPDNLVVTLGRDNNNHDAILVEAPFDTTSKLLAMTFPRIGWSVKTHSVEKAQYEVEVLDSQDQMVKLFKTRGLPIDHGSYKIRIGLMPNACAVTFYDKDDNPLPSRVVSDIYPGFADQLVEEFSEYNQQAPEIVKAK